MRRAILARIVLSFGLVAMLALPAAAGVSAQVMPGPTLVVGNPNPGDMLTLGKLEMQGVAFDPLATNGSGIDRVSVFLDNRDEGGMFLGDAQLGTPAVIPTQTADTGWMLVTPALKGVGDGHSLFVYARSAVTGDETVVKIPVTIGDTVHATGTDIGTFTPGEPAALPVTPEGPPADTSGM